MRFVNDIKQNAPPGVPADIGTKIETMFKTCKAKGIITFVNHMFANIMMVFLPLLVIVGCEVTKTADGIFQHKISCFCDLKHNYSSGQ